VLHPTALLVEAEALAAEGVDEALSRLAVHRRARVTTPYHQALGRLRELARGTAAHGTCGAGVGETVADHLARPDEAITAGHLADAGTLAARLAATRERLRRQAGELNDRLPSTARAEEELEVFALDEVARRWLDATARCADAIEAIGDDEVARRLAAEPAVVFEGAQGVLLDERHGFHPHTTWSDCTPAGALEILAAVPGAEITTVGVLRSHAVRHGPGPLPTEGGALAAIPREHNRNGGWQGALRYGPFDAVLARYALDAVGGVDRLAITHLDLLERLETWRWADSYRWPGGTSDDDWVTERCTYGHCRRLAPPDEVGLARQERLTRWLERIEPVYEEVAASEEAVLAAIETALGRPVDVVSRGPTAGDVKKIR
ncbi:MAG TPA: adenylosuccinate synthetase, partial [Thermoanaerobaculia bacterium]|nr:adenylosuccinate synthetase [Thermoanaerobaculia bacterium]